MSVSPWAIEVDGLVRRFAAAAALRGVELRVVWGERVAVLGPNGAGKTTLLKVLATLLRPSAGRAAVGGRDTVAAGDEARRRVGFVGHQTYLYPDLSVEENLHFYGRLYGVPPSAAVFEARLRAGGLWGRRAERVRSLSRGLQQRAAIVRALVHDPALLLLDEPDAGLDEAGLLWLEQLITGEGRTVLLVSHAPHRARAWCQRVVTLDGGRIAKPQSPPAPEGAAALAAADASAPTPPGTVRQAWIILRKDVLLEWRTRELVLSTALFGVLSLLVFTFALDLRTDNAALVVPGALWIAITFAGVSALGRSLGLERERDTLEGLLLTPVDRGALFLAKMAGITLAMLAVEAVLVPVCAAFFAVPLLHLRLLPVLLLGTLGLSGVGTLTGAMAVNARSRDILLPVLLFPLAVPVVIGSVKATAAVVDGVPFGPWLGLLAAFDAIFFVVAWWLFDHVVED